MEEHANEFMNEAVLEEDDYEGWNGQPIKSNKTCVNLKDPGSGDAIYVAIGRCQ
jgi:hypothetical protein